MSTEQMTTADTNLRDRVLWQLEWDPEVDASGIGVAAKDAAVTLTGHISSYGGKLAAERACKHVNGVRAVANDIEVTAAAGRTDSDIADDIVHALRIHERVPSTVQATVHYANVTLTGRVEWLFQKEAAERAIRHIRGVRHVVNHVDVAPRAIARDVRRRIVKALHQHAAVDAQKIKVDVTGHIATLTGQADSWFERDAAERAAAQAEGITEIDNRVVVIPTDVNHDDDLRDEEC